MTMAGKCHKLKKKQGGAYSLPKANRRSSSCSWALLARFHIVSLLPHFHHLSILPRNRRWKCHVSDNYSPMTGYIFP